MSERITYQGTNFVELLGTVDVATGAYLATGTAIARLYDDTKDTTVAPITGNLVETSITWPANRIRGSSAMTGGKVTSGLLVSRVPC